MKQLDFTYNLPQKIERLEKYISLLKEEVSEYKKILRSDDGNMSNSGFIKLTPEDHIKYIDIEKKVFHLENEISREQNYLNILKEKAEVDEREYNTRLKEATINYSSIVKKADDFVDKDFEINKEVLSVKANMVQYLLNELLRNKQNNNSRGIEFFYTAIKKELAENGNVYIQRATK